MENPLSTFFISLAIIMMVCIAGAVFFINDYDSCLKSCKSESCKIPRCDFGVNDIGFSCVKTAIADCCGNGGCDGTENKCTCPQDCGSCAGSAGKCQELFCSNDNLCIEKQISNCCGNGICEIGEDFMHCPEDCSLNKNGTMKNYNGPDDFDKTLCDNTPFIQCIEGKYGVFDKNNHLVIGYNLPGYNLTASTKGTARFYAYVKKDPADNGRVLVSISINGIYVGDMDIEYSSWDSGNYGFAWKSVSFPLNYLKKGFNSFRFEGSGWYAVAQYNNSYMTKLTWVPVVKSQ